jgi:transcriptional regulator with XRE-family HTH domain
MTARQPSSLGLAIKLARTSANLSLRELSHKSGVDHVSIHRIENGTVQDMGTAKVAAIASALGLTLDDLVTQRFEICPACQGLGIVRKA